MATDDTDDSTDDESTEPFADPPPVKDHPGQADNRFSRGYLGSLPVILVIAALGGLVLVWAGVFRLDSTTVSTRYLLHWFVRPVVYVALALYSLGYVLSLAREYGIAPIAWFANAAHGWRKDR